MPGYEKNSAIMKWRDDWYVVAECISTDLEQRQEGTVPVYESHE